MRKFTVTVVVVTIAAAVAGFYLRMQEMQNGFEPLTNLEIRGSASGVLFIGFSMCFIALMLLFTVVVRVKHAEVAVHTGDGVKTTFRFLMIISAIIYAAAAIAAMYIMFSDTSKAGTVDRSRTVFMIFCGLSGVAVLLSSFRKSYLKENWLWTALALIPEVFFTIWLIVLYQTNQTNPVMIYFLPKVFAVVAAAMSFYYTAGYEVKRAAPARLIFFHCMAVYLTAVSLADPLQLYERLLFASVLVYLAIRLIRYALSVKVVLPDKDGTEENALLN